MQEATDELLENIRKTLYYRGIHGLDSCGRIGIYFTNSPEEAKFYDEKIIKAYLNPKKALVSETSVDLAEMLGLSKEYDELVGTGRYIESDDLLSRKGLKLGYDTFVRRGGDWVVVLKPDIIKEVREESYSMSERPISPHKIGADPLKMPVGAIQDELNLLLFDGEFQRACDATDRELLTIVIAEPKAHHFDFLTGKTEWKVRGKWKRPDEGFDIERNVQLDVEFKDSAEESIGKRVIQLLRAYNTKVVSEKVLYARTMPIEEGTL